MKKYLLGITAVILAIGFSAFQKNTILSKEANAKPQPSLYWYHINSNGSLGSALNSGTQMTKNTALGYSSCSDIISTDCDRGFSTTQVVNTNPAPDTDSGDDYHILKNN